MVRPGLRRWAKPLRFSHICISLILFEKGGCFQDILPPFSYLKIAFFLKRASFL